MIPAGVAVEENIKPAIRHLMKKIELFRSEGHRVPPHKIIKNKRSDRRHESQCSN